MRNRNRQNERERIHTNKYTRFLWFYLHFLSGSVSTAAVAVELPCVWLMVLMPFPWHFSFIRQKQNEAHVIIIWEKCKIAGNFVSKISFNTNSFVDLQETVRNDCDFVQVLQRIHFNSSNQCIYFGGAPLDCVFFSVRLRKSKIRVDAICSGFNIGLILAIYSFESAQCLFFFSHFFSFGRLLHPKQTISYFGALSFTVFVYFIQFITSRGRLTIDLCFDFFCASYNSADIDCYVCVLA